MRPTEDLTGKHFGKWSVLHRDKTYECNEYNAYWLCRCECGFEKPVNGSHLRLGKSLSCRKCSEQKHKGKLSSRIWCRIKRSARIRGLELDLGSDAEACEFLYKLLYEEQKCICALSGLPIAIASTVKGDQQGDTTASVDRMDSSKGYIKSNVQWVHKWINQDEFITFCEAVVRHKRK